VTTSGNGLPVEFIVTGVPASSQAKNLERKRKWMADVRQAAQAVWSDSPLGTKVRVGITYYVRGGKLPDVDNMAKPILDAITSTVWVDDIQVDSVRSGRVDLDGLFRLSGLSVALLEGFHQNQPFVHVRIVDFSSQEFLP
jgi:crossover junction endodeoxyribonuclease RusA